MIQPIQQQGLSLRRAQFNAGQRGLSVTDPGQSFALNASYRFAFWVSPNTAYLYA
jgi:hypothetical protein